MYYFFKVSVALALLKSHIEHNYVKMTVGVVAVIQYLDYKCILVIGKLSIYHTCTYILKKAIRSICFDAPKTLYLF